MHPWGRKSAKVLHAGRTGIQCGSRETAGKHRGRGALLGHRKKGRLRTKEY